MLALTYLKHLMFTKLTHDNRLVLIFMQRVKISSIPKDFKHGIHSISHSCRRRFSKDICKQPHSAINYKKSSVGSRGPQLWKKILSEQEKIMTSISFFKNTVKEMLLPSAEYEISYI